MSDIHPVTRAAALYAVHRGFIIPEDTFAKLARLGVFAGKAIGDLTAISSEYHDAIVKAIVSYFDDSRRRQNANQDFRRATTQAFGDGMDTGWLDGGGELPIDADALEWLLARQQQEYGYINALFVQMKDLKAEEGFDYFTFATERADGYVATLFSVYNQGKLMAAKNVMLTFDGEDGAESCPTCQKYKGQRHRASWWIARDLIPRPGNLNFECKGYRCQHGLKDDKGNWYTR